MYLLGHFINKLCSDKPESETKLIIRFIRAQLTGLHTTP